MRLATKHHIEDAHNTHADGTIVLVLIWATLQNHSVLWASKPTNWPGDLVPRGGLPSQSCASRRMQTLGLLSLMQRLEEQLRSGLPCSDNKLIDRRPLPVGGCSKDLDAKRGYGAACTPPVNARPWA